MAGKITWTKYVTRRLCVQMAQAWNFGLGEASKKVYGTGVTNTLVIRDEKKTEYYMDSKQLVKYQADLDKLLENPNFLRTFHPKAQDALERIFKKIQSGLNVDLSKLSNTQLRTIYSNLILPNQTQFYVHMWNVFNIGDPVLANAVERKLRKTISGETEITEALLKLSSPFVPNDAVLQRMGILEIASKQKKLSKNSLKKRILKHTARFRHIPMYDIDHTPYSEQYFFKELRRLKNPAQELYKLKSLQKVRRSEYKRILKKLKPNKQFKALLDFLKENVYLRDYRDSIRQRLNLELKKFYSETATRLGLTLEQILGLTNNEILHGLKTSTRFPRKEAQIRDTSYLLVQKGSVPTIYSGKVAAIKAKRELKISQKNSVRQLSGNIGCAGKAVGKAKIVYTNRDLHKVKSGDILIATMTRQDFVPYIRRAAGLITDEGSVTAHAAIVAREFKIPCLVGTKLGTKIFKDGDLVEVDANKGIVRKITK